MLAMPMYTSNSTSNKHRDPNLQGLWTGKISKIYIKDTKNDYTCVVNLYKKLD